MSGNSSVGQRTVYEDGDQRNYPESEIKTAERYKEGKENSHKANDSSEIDQAPFIIVSTAELHRL